MDNLDKLKKQIKSMDRSKRNELLDALDSALSDKQKEKLRQMLSAKEGKAELERQLQNTDVDSLISNAGSKEQLLSYIDKSDIRKKINDILG